MPRRKKSGLEGLTDLRLLEKLVAIVEGFENDVDAFQAFRFGHEGSYTTWWNEEVRLRNNQLYGYMTSSRQEIDRIIEETRKRLAIAGANE